MSSIIVANSNPDYAKRIAALLHSTGLYVGNVSATGASVIDFAHRHYHGGVVITSVKLRDMPAINLPDVIPNYDFLFLVSSQFSAMCERAGCASLILPVKRRDLISTVNMFLNISDFTPLSIKKKLAADNFDEKAVIKRAKDLLIVRNHLTEPQAHRFIQKKSMDTGKKMAETSLIILNT